MTDDPTLGTRELTDARSMRALTHPTRIALIEALTLGGALTATEAAEAVGESPSSCSFHLRQLARYGFVEEAGGGTGRRRPWRLTRMGVNFSSVQDDPAAEIAAAALSDLFRDRQLRRLETWRRTGASYPRAWREAATSSEYVMWVTPDELRALTARVAEEFGHAHRERLTDPSQRPADARPVELLFYGYPLGPGS